MLMNHRNLFSLVTARQFNVGGKLQPSMREIARRMKVTPSTFTRLRDGKAMSVDAFLKIIQWLHSEGYSISAVMDSVLEKPAKRRVAK